MVPDEVRQGILGVDGRGWGLAGNTGRGWSWSSSDKEYCVSRAAIERTRRKEMRRGEEEERRGEGN